MKRRNYIICTFIMIILSFLLIITDDKTDNEKYTNEPISKTAFYLDTFVTVQVYDCKDNYNEKIRDVTQLTDIVTQAVNLCGKYEMIFSKTNENSQLYKVNNSENEYSEISKDLYDVINKSLYYSDISNGKLDITISRLTDIWNFKNETIPNENTITKALETVNYKNITLTSVEEKYYITIDGESEIDLGSIAKGYIADEIRTFLLDKGVYSAIINLGGNILVMGKKPDGSDYSLGIQKPFAKDGEILCTAIVSDKSLVTSGVYERTFESNGQHYHHIVDPDIGYPAKTDVYSASIISENSIDADALSTVCVLIGIDAATRMINSIDGVECILISDDYEIILSDGLSINNNIIALK